ncbi:hypothetical protein [Stenotrophomonas sp. HMWF003]|uniref:hypothetical protein n=1 Tax=Stenotrophomonas sp. HMWF003 TaxID=2056840 RepID=UPI001C63117A|nr:hypothetical protein [Stenotrophomonas sp. HMWF003]
MTNAFPAPSRLHRDALVALIVRIQAAPGTEQDTDADIQRLVEAVLDPNAVNYIFHDDLSATEIADRILQYRPVVL